MEETERDYENCMKRLAKAQEKTWIRPHNEEEKIKDGEEAMRWFEEYSRD